MIKYENMCVGPCPMGCLGATCPNRHVATYCCDNCGEESTPEELHDVDGDMVCEECLFEMFPKITI